MPTDYIFTHALYVFTTDRWDLFAVVHSTLHEVWARKYSGSLKTGSSLFALGLLQHLCLRRRALADRRSRPRRTS